MRQFKRGSSVTIRNTRSITTYLADVARYPLLTDSEECELAYRIQKGDLEARDKLVVANLRFVVSVANQYKNKDLPLEDLITEGNIGLTKAAERFDPTRGFKFISYAIWWIRQSIMDFQYSQATLIRKPLNAVAIENKVYKIKSEAYNLTGEEMNEADIMELADLSEAEYSRYKLAHAAVFSGDAPIGPNEDTTVFDYVSTQENTDDGLFEEDRESALYNAIDKLLSKRDARILSKLFGLGCRPKTLMEVASEENLTTERVRQIRCKAITKLKSGKCKAYLRDFV